MARWDIKIYEPIDPKFTTSPLVQLGASASAILAGTPAMCGSSGYVIAAVDGSGTTGVRFAGIAKGDSTETTVADGRVALWLPLPGMIYSGVAKSGSTLANTQALIDALYYKRVVFDLANTGGAGNGGAWTVDTGATDAATNSMVILGGDYNTYTIYFTIGYGGDTLLG